MPRTPLTVTQAQAEQVARLAALFETSLALRPFDPNEETGVQLPWVWAATPKHEFGIKDDGTVMGWNDL